VPIEASEKEYHEAPLYDRSNRDDDSPSGDADSPSSDAVTAPTTAGRRRGR
jgi:hypothetical protein